MLGYGEEAWHRTDLSSCQVLLTESQIRAQSGIVQLQFTALNLVFAALRLGAGQL